MSIPEPDRDCPLCPRLVAYRHANREACPDWHNAPAPPFGASDSWLLILGLAPGRTGANRTGRVFTGDAAGGFLFDTLLKTGLATGTYRADGHDDMQLDGCLISNAVLCAPPANRPTPGEENACRPHLTALLDHLASLEVIITLGDIARRNLLKA
ncbi:MAG: uracil-DNA glycosylase, partial [Asticcacaulis sp.]|nr:uracil-DNA glycosylase [Asticcacaulis sp.]